MANESRDTTEPSPSLGEEIASSVSHGLGLLIALVAGPLLIVRAARQDQPWGATSASVFVVTIWLMYAASMLYHALPRGRAKRIFRTVEHGAIFLLIAGTYTPFTLVALRVGLDNSLGGVGAGHRRHFAEDRRPHTTPVVARRALSGTRMADHRRHSAAFPTFIARRTRVAARRRRCLHSGNGLFSARYVPYCHFVWHLFVMAGTTCHFVAVWCYVV